MPRFLQCLLYVFIILMATCNHASSDIDVMKASISSNSGGGGSGQPVCILHVNISLSEKEQYYRNDNLTLTFTLVNKDSHDIHEVELEAELTNDFLNATDQSNKRFIYIYCPKLPKKSHKIFPFTIHISPKAIQGSQRTIIVPGSIKIDFKEKYSAPQIDSIEKPILIINRIPTIISSKVNILSPCIPSDKELFVLENNKIVKISLSVRANDDDGDPITYRWIIPETGKVIEETKENSDNLTLNFTNGIIGKKINFIVSANDGYNDSANNSSILSYKDAQYYDIIIPEDNYYSGLTRLLILMIVTMLIITWVIKKYKNKIPFCGYKIKYILLLYLIFISIFTVFRSINIFINLGISALLIIIVYLISNKPERTRNKSFIEFIKRNKANRDLLDNTGILILVLSLITSYLYLFGVGFLKYPGGSPILIFGFPLLFNSTYFLEILIFLIVFLYIVYFNQGCFRDKCNELPDRLWMINSVSMATLLLSLCIVIPQINDTKMPDHLHYYYSSIIQVFATILAIVVAVTDKINRQEIKKFARLYIAIILLSFLGLSAFAYNFKFSPILEPLDSLSWIPLLVFETTLLMIPAAIFSLYGILELENTTK